ncbi:MAG: hypothetical protein MZV64_42855 [Ignavibacteriales bacterium]|nr:hypothetical protein [Ignavibacteriales bacterium]
MPGPGPRVHELRCLRPPRPEAARQAPELPRHRQGLFDSLLQPQQPRLDLPHRVRTRNHRQAGRRVRGRGDRGPGATSAWTSGRTTPAPACRPSSRPWRGIHGQVRAADFKLQGVQLRRRTGRHARGVRRNLEPARAGPQAVLPVRPARLRDGVRSDLRAVVRDLPLGAVRPGGRAQSRERR